MRNGKKKVHYVRCLDNAWANLKVLAALRRRTVGEMLERIIESAYRKTMARKEKNG